MLKKSSLLGMTDKRRTHRRGGSRTAPIRERPLPEKRALHEAPLRVVSIRRGA